MRPVSTFLLVLCFLAAIIIAAASLKQGVPLDQVLLWMGTLLACLWGWVLLTLPWDLHFKAREILASMGAMYDARGEQQRTDPGAEPLPVPSTTDFHFAATTKRRTLAISIGLHLVSSTAALIVALRMDSVLAYAFAGFFLLGCLVRPGIAVFQQIRRRLEKLEVSGRFPQENVQTLLLMYRAQTKTIAELERDVRCQNVELGSLKQKFTDFERGYKDQLAASTRLREQDAQDAQRAQDERFRRLLDEVQKIERGLSQGNEAQDIMRGMQALVALVHKESRA